MSSIQLRGIFKYQGKILAAKVFINALIKDLEMYFLSFELLLYVSPCQAQRSPMLETPIFSSQADPHPKTFTRFSSFHFQVSSSSPQEDLATTPLLLPLTPESSSGFQDSRPHRLQHGHDRRRRLRGLQRAGTERVLRVPVAVPLHPALGELQHHGSGQTHRFGARLLESKSSRTGI